MVPVGPFRRFGGLRADSRVSSWICSRAGLGAGPAGFLIGSDPYVPPASRYRANGRPVGGPGLLAPRTPFGRS
jgi:hypothetical protein